MGRNPTDELERDISLPFESDPASGVHGYFRTQEGRSYLREVFGEYLAHAQVGRGKVATLIADRRGSLDAQEQEADRTRSALRRWQEDGQAELWPKEPERNLEYLERLEIEMMQSPPVAARLGATAVSIRRMQTGEAFARFFYGTRSSARLSNEIAERQASLEGLMEERHAKFISADTDWEMAGYYADPNFRYVFLYRVPERSFMLMHGFSLGSSGPPNGESPVTDVRSGYAYPMADGSVHCLLRSHEAGVSVYDTYTRVRDEDVPVYWGLNPKLIVGNWSRSSSKLGHGLGFVPFEPGGELRLPNEKRLVNWARARPQLVPPEVEAYTQNILQHVLV